MARGTLMPFLYPLYMLPRPSLSRLSVSVFISQYTREFASLASTKLEDASATEMAQPSRLNPPPDDYSRSIFADKCTLTVASGSGGHGCVSFLREKYIAAGPANGGDGGSGGNVYIQAVRGTTSLHKLARRGKIRASRGQNGQGKNKDGQRGEDVLIQVPVGTVVRELSRRDPVAEEEKRMDDVPSVNGETRGQWRRDKWVLYPSSLPSDYATTEFPALPRLRRSNLASAQPDAPIHLDLSSPMEQPILLAAGAVGGLGNPRFLTRQNPRPKFATKGEMGMTITLELELKLLADVGFVGLPNAGKSTLLRALSNSRARVGNWEFTTLQPNIGTVILDNHMGRPILSASRVTGEARTQFTVADIPGLVPDAHLDRGLGLGFLRHIERAKVIALVIDLSNGDAISTLQKIWRELVAFEGLRDMKTNAETESRIVEWKALNGNTSAATYHDEAMATNDASFMIPPSQMQALPALPLMPISTKPWFVVATKADLTGTHENFDRLKTYLEALSSRAVPHPSGQRNAWNGNLTAIPVSAIRGEGVDRIPEWTVGLLDD